MAGVGAWSRLNAAGVASAHYNGFCERGQQPKLATSAVMRKLVALGDILLRQDSLWQDVAAETFRLA